MKITVKRYTGFGNKGVSIDNTTLTELKKKIEAFIYLYNEIPYVSLPLGLYGENKSRTKSLGEEYYEKLYNGIEFTIGRTTITDNDGNTIMFRDRKFSCLLYI